MEVRFQLGRLSVHLKSESDRYANAFNPFSDADFAVIIYWQCCPISLTAAGGADAIQ